MRRLALAALPTVLLLAACGPGQEIAVTNDNNVVLNDAQANYAFTNDGEMPGNQSDVAANMAAANQLEAAGVANANAAGNGTMANGM